MGTRTIVGAILAAILLTAWGLGGIWLQGLAYIMLIIAAYEMVTSFRQADRRVHAFPCGAFIVMLPVMLWMMGEIGVFSATLLAVMLTFVQQVFTRELNLQTLTATTFVIVYPLSLFGVLISMTQFIGEYGRLAILLTIVIASLTDMAAYYTGMAIGRQKLIPEISPKKTVEGAIGGVMGGVIGSVLVCLIVQPMLNTHIAFGWFLLLGLLGSVLGQIGDLAASLVKRTLGVKDYGNLLPGHGGVMDRMDSILFVAPLVYFVFHIII